MIDCQAKRAACLIASQLPEDAVEAMRVLEYAADIIRHLHKDQIGAVSRPVPVVRTGLGLAPVSARANLICFPGIANPA